MNIADRIQHLRKIRGLSQEELADKIGVSRQSVSKWESEQSTPDIEKVILMSNYFEVTTDYLLKGIEPAADTSASTNDEPNAGVFSVTGTAFNIMGVIIASMIWYEEQNATATAIGLILAVIGCMIFAIGLIVSDAATKEKAKRSFWTVNIWVFTFMPLSILYNILSGFGMPAPYPILVGSLLRYALFWVIYITIGLAVNLLLHRKRIS